MAKADALAAQAVADGALYDAGFADGVASVPAPAPAPASVSAAQVVADLQALQSSDDAAIAALVTKYSPAAS